jgi:DNA-binding MarR family transcriptional regulator
MKSPSPRAIDYQALADFRFEIRRFLNFSERLVHAAGMEPQQHQALLAIKGLPAHRVATVGVLAERLLIQHHSAVELVNRLEAKGLLRRARSGPPRSRIDPVTSRRKVAQTADASAPC